MYLQEKSIHVVFKFPNSNLITDLKVIVIYYNLDI
jgi:hypothetical protein